MAIVAQEIFTIIHLGSLVVYTMQPVAEWTEGLPTKGIYWRDNASPQGEGPFNSLAEAMNDYSWVVTNFKKIQDEKNRPLAPIIRVDFRNRKRMA